MMMSNTGNSQLLNAQAITGWRDAFGVLADVEVVQETGSTNTDLMQRLATLERPLLLVAERQTAGRGRAGRSWLSVPGGVLTFSLAWKLPQSGAQLMGLPLVIGLAAAETLKALAVPVGLKWPNDIWRDGKKMGGILVESAPAAGGGTWIVGGIGLNLLVPEALEATLGVQVADAPWLAQMDRNQLLGTLLNALARLLEQFAISGFAPFAARWNALHVFAGQMVQIQDQGKVLLEGQALGVDEEGYLLLNTPAGVRRVVSGDVSLRPVKE